eukprot:SAG11_NODE_6040_length_1403_cov_2.409509_1_plen_284_part_00
MRRPADGRGLSDAHPTQCAATARKGAATRSLRAALICPPLAAMPTYIDTIDIGPTDGPKDEALLSGWSDAEGGAERTVKVEVVVTKKVRSVSGSSRPGSRDSNRPRSRPSSRGSDRSSIDATFSRLAESPSVDGPQAHPPPRAAQGWTSLNSPAPPCAPGPFPPCSSARTVGEPRLGGWHGAAALRHAAPAKAAGGGGAAGAGAARGAAGSCGGGGGSGAAAQATVGPHAVLAAGGGAPSGTRTLPPPPPPPPPVSLPIVSPIKADGACSGPGRRRSSRPVAA